MSKPHHPIDFIRLAIDLEKAVNQVTEGDPEKLGVLINQFKKQLHEAVKETKHDGVVHDPSND